MLLPTYKFYIDSVEVYPHYNKLSKKYERESNQQFFRDKLEGTIKLVGSDFSKMVSLSIEQDYRFDIFRLNHTTREYDLYYSGYFNKTDCKFNYDLNVCELGFKTNDQYTEIMSKYEDTIDLLRYGIKTTKVGISKRSVIQIHLSNSNILTNFLGGGIYWEQDCNTDTDDVLTKKYHFARSHAFHNIDRIIGPGLQTSLLASIRYADVINMEGANRTLFIANYYSEDALFYVKMAIVAGTGAFYYDPSLSSASSLGIYRTSDDAKLYTVKNTTESDIEGYLNQVIMTPTGVDPSLTLDTVLYSNPIEFVYSRLLCDVKSVGGKDTYPLELDDIVENNGNYKYVMPWDFDEIYGSNRFSINETPYGNNADGKFYLPPESTYGDKFFPINRSFWYDTYSIWFNFGSEYYAVEEQVRKEYLLRDGYYIADIIKALLKQIAPSITHEPTAEYSQILYADENPLGLQKFYLFLTQKSNLLKGEYDRAAQKVELSFKDLMGALWSCFKVRWFIDDQQRLRIEHIFWFLNGQSYTLGERTVGLDLTTQYDRKNLKALSSFQNVIEYNKSELASRFEFSWMDNCSNAFEGISLDVVSKYVSTEKIESVSASIFTPDVDYMLAAPSDFSQDGFALLCAIKEEGSYKLPFIPFEIKDTFEEGTTYTITAQNGLASWLYLLNYYMYDMPGTNINYDFLAGAPLQVKNIYNSMSQKIEFPSAEDPDVFALIKTEIGAGVIDSLTIDLINRQATAALRFPPK